MEATNHNLALRLYAGPILLQETATPMGKEFYLLNLPYFLGENLPAYIAWMQAQVA